MLKKYTLTWFCCSPQNILHYVLYSHHCALLPRICTISQTRFTVQYCHVFVLLSKPDSLILSQASIQLATMVKLSHIRRVNISAHSHNNAAVHFIIFPIISQIMYYMGYLFLFLRIP